MEAAVSEGAEEVHAFRTKLAGQKVSAGDGPLSGLVHSLLVLFPLFLEAFAPGSDVGSI